MIREIVQLSMVSVETLNFVYSQTTEDNHIPISGDDLAIYKYRLAISPDLR